MGGGAQCATIFTDIDARVVCRQLGLAGGVVGDTRGPFDSPILMDNVACVGTESTLLDCPHTAQHNCAHLEDVWVACTAPFPPECALAQETFMRPLDNIEGQPRTTTVTVDGCRQRCNDVIVCAWWTWQGDGGCHISNSSSVAIRDATGQYGVVSSGPRCRRMLQSEPAWTVCHRLAGGTQFESTPPSTSAASPPAQPPSLVHTPPTVASPLSKAPSSGPNSGLSATPTSSPSMRPSTTVPLMPPTGMPSLTPTSPSSSSGSSGTASLAPTSPSSSGGSSGTASDESTALDPSVLIGMVVGAALVVLCGVALAWRCRSSQCHQPAEHTTAAAITTEKPAFVNSEFCTVAEPAESAYNRPDSTQQLYANKVDHQVGRDAQPVTLNPAYASAEDGVEHEIAAIYAEVDPRPDQVLYAAVDAVDAAQSDSNC